MNQSLHTDSSNSGFVVQVPLDQHPFFTQIEKIDSEGFNQLYTAERYGKKWMLKGLKAEYQQQPLYVELLKKELDILMSLSYPYIVQAVGVELIPDLGPCIIMEYVDGMTLGELVRRKEMSQKQKLKIVGQLLETLHYVHGKQVVHRDLKPTNIIVTHNGGNVKLIDFGLADTDAYRILKQPAGTLNYISPEQLKGGPADIRNDIYSLGRILEDLKLGRKYEKVVRHCLLPMGQRYVDTSQLSEAMQRVNRLRNRTMVWGVVAVFCLFLGYLTWQIRVLQEKMPAERRGAEMLLAEEEGVDPLLVTVADTLEEDVEAVGRKPDKGRKQAVPAVDDGGQHLAVDMEQLIKEGKRRIEEYKALNDIDWCMNRLTDVKDLDVKRYHQVMEQVSLMINDYVAEVRATCGTEQSRCVADSLGNFLLERYLNRWNAKSEDLCKKNQNLYGGM